MMTPEEKPNTLASRETPVNQRSEGFIKGVGRDVGKELLRETWTTVKWTIGGTVFGSIVVGGRGLWKFGITGMVLGVFAGTLIGGALGGWAYFSA
ncbi:MAG: hypothetical protein P1U77_01415 [Rubripirellula sp.]|jgi:hypothetical protein|nr:hypothetical protein [Rubripirellula sp.]